MLTIARSIFWGPKGIRDIFPIQQGSLAVVCEINPAAIRQLG